MPCAHHKHDNVDGIVRNEPWVDTEREFVKVCHCENCVRHGFAVELMEVLRKHFGGSSMQLVASPSPGTCARGNSIMINDQVAVLQDMQDIASRVEKELQRQREEKVLNPDKHEDVIKVCFGPSCGVRQAEEIEKQLWRKYQKEDEVKIMRCGCTGNCAKANNIVVNGNIISRQSPLYVFKNVESERGKQRRERIKTTGPITVDEADKLLGI